ncbi:MAG: twin-arginine translocation signal domain-containing protein [Gammaproteobacteria bacterium]|jgi:nitrous oxide reductase
MHEQDNKSSSRRHFLKGAVALGAGAAVVSAVGAETLDKAAVTEPAMDESKPDKGYRVTSHIVDYYRSLAE